MLLDMFLKGSLVGFSVAMPIGPIGIICIQHAILRGMLYGLVAGLGVALADGLYGIMAGIGVSAISSALVYYQFWFHLVGAAILWYLGVSILRSQTILEESECTQVGLWRVFLSTFAITMTNPMTGICFAGIYAGLGICTADESWYSVLSLATGVLIGSAAWWVILSGGIALIRKKISLRTAIWLNRLSGGFILLCAVGTTFIVVRQFLT